MCTAENQSWDSIQNALRLTLNEQQLDLSSTKRLQYEDFERILFHLFLFADSKDARRRFRGIYPARSREDRRNFFDKSVGFIHDKQLCSQRVSPKHLEVLGGEIFRRLLAAIIKNLMIRDTERIKKLLPPDCDMPDYNRLIEAKCDQGQMLLVLDEKIATVMRNKSALESAMDRHRDVKAQLQATQQVIREKKEMLMQKFQLSFPSSDSINDEQVIRTIYKNSLERFEKATDKLKVAQEKVRRIKLPPPDKVMTNQVAGRCENKKRLSQYIREVRRQFELDSPEPSPQANRSKLIERVNQEIRDYDSTTSRLISKWRERKQAADVEYLKAPENQELRKICESILPKLDFVPIDQILDSSDQDISYAMVGKIFTEDPDSIARQILDLAKKFFS